MKKPGYIRFIDNKVKFEYYELEKPDIDDYISEFLDGLEDFYQAERDYEASKRVIEVSNILYYRGNPETAALTFETKEEPIFVIGGESCKAEVENNIATIIELTKE